MSRTNGTPLQLSRRILYGVPVATIIATGVAVYIGIGLLYNDEWDWHNLVQSLLRATAYVLVIWPACVLTSKWTLSHWSLSSKRDVARHVGALVASVFAGFTAVTALLRVVDGEATPFPIFVLIAAVSTLAAAILATTIYGVLAVQRMRASEAAAVAAELRALRAQINPHFLFNALNAIAALVRERPDAAERVTEDLADLFRYSLSASDRPTVTLAEEAESARLYLGIEQARFGDDLVVRFEVPDELARARVPSLILQPLVENAVKHGVRHRAGVGAVHVSAWADEASLFLRVADTGPGFGGAGIEDVLGRGTGLTNVDERLRVFDARSELRLDDVENGGAIVVRLPLSL